MRIRQHQIPLENHHKNKQIPLHPRSPDILPRSFKQLTNNVIHNLLFKLAPLEDTQRPYLIMFYIMRYVHVRVLALVDL